MRERWVDAEEDILLAQALRNIRSETRVLIAEHIDPTSGATTQLALSLCESPIRKDPVGVLPVVEVPAKRKTFPCPSAQVVCVRVHLRKSYASKHVIIQLTHTSKDVGE